MSNEIEFSPGSILAGRFRLISELGAGGMGVAYRAWDQQADIPVVIKMPRRELLAKDPQFAKRFDREIRMMASLTHPNIVPIVDFGEDSGLPYVAMRFLPGGSLSNRRLRNREGKVTPNHPSTLHLWLPGIASALDMVHSARIVHRDVKPGNIFFDGFWTAFLGDFGVAKLLQDPESGLKEETLTGTNVGIGTPDYMSPEQFSPKAVLDGRSDQYALGIMVYEMLSGTRPFRGDTNHFAVEHLTMPPPLLSSRCAGLPKSLCNAVHRSLSKKPDERFKSCREFATAVLSDVPRQDLESDVVRLLCPSCGKIMKLPLTSGGKKGKCSKCQTAMNVAKDLGALWLEIEVVSLKFKSQKISIFTEKPLSILPRRQSKTFAAMSHLGLSNNDPIEKVFKAGETVTNLIGMKLIEIPAGTFTMGSPETEKDRADNEEQVDVTLTKPFGLGKTQVTQGQWKSVMGTEPWKGEDFVQFDNDCPATYISFFDAIEFCEKLTEIEHKAWTLKVNEEYHLPTEAEWEYACRAGTTTEFSFGDESKINSHAWWGGLDLEAIDAGENKAGPGNAAREQYAHKVGMKKPNPVGLHDMHGNVFEWCSDWYDDSLPGGTDPVGPDYGSYRVFRGGSWWRDPGRCRSALRLSHVPSSRFYDLGFRVARSQSAQ